MTMWRWVGWWRGDDKVKVYGGKGEGEAIEGEMEVEGRWLNFEGEVWTKSNKVRDYNSLGFNKYNNLNSWLKIIL